MSKIVVVYYSRTGNTEKMAKAISQGAQEVPGIEVRLILDFEAVPREFESADAIFVGVPTYHHDMTRGIKQLFEELAVQQVNLENKVGVCFGSFGWSGEAPRLTQEIMENRFGMRVRKPPLLVKYSPDEKALEKCRMLGKEVAQQL